MCTLCRFSRQSKSRRALVYVIFLRGGTASQRDKYEEGFSSVPRDSSLLSALQLARRGGWVCVPAVVPPSSISWGEQRVTVFSSTSERCWKWRLLLSLVKMPRPTHTNLFLPSFRLPLSFPSTSFRPFLYSSLRFFRLFPFTRNIVTYWRKQLFSILFCVHDVEIIILVVIVGVSVLWALVPVTNVSSPNALPLRSKTS